MLSAENIIQWGGYLGLFGVVFVESGLLIGLILPGDSLLFTAGFFASQELFNFNIWIVAGGCFVAAVLGDSVGYMFGKRTGKHIFRRKESVLFNPAHIDRAQRFYEKYGSKTIVLARFVPIIRTFAPILAGVGAMPYRTFITYNVLGGFIWSVGISFLGFSIGSAFPGLGDHLEIIIVFIIGLSILPALSHVMRDPVQRQQLVLLARTLGGRFNRSK